VLPGVVRIPARNSFVEGAMLEPVNTVLKAVNRLALRRGDSVLVIGQGPIGLMFTKLLRLRGMKVVATDLMDSRLKLARQWGATAAFRGDDGGLPNKLAKAAPCLDAAVVAVPSQAAVSQALELVRGSGKVLLFAHTHRGAESRIAVLPSDASYSSDPPDFPQLDLSTICVEEKDLIGSYSADFTLQEEVARLIFSRKLDVRKLVTDHFSLEQTVAAIALASSPAGDSLKVVVNQAVTNQELPADHADWRR
jgi:L-iditol 2-dehydrogenase